MKRRSQMQGELAARIVSLPEMAGVLFCVDREDPFEEDHLPAVNLTRVSDELQEVVGDPSGGAASLSRRLTLSLDLYAEGESRFGLLDNVEEAILRCLLTLDPVPALRADRIRVGVSEFEQESFLSPVCATRIPITIDYTINF
ncbi:hypothetical protein [Chromobacterium violaceum]|uniref:hypothetical protein n=1 Tax=Chromobacterium violaceum TaxID=536 RepID=UPI0015FBFB91|nr:hypothetical protein [Chromobacterium violaceum]MBA8734227.1 hypothetical protein [Chromobacterium violaceum]